jgi:hypothetical protein
MQFVKDQLKELFTELNERIEKINRERRADGALPIPKAKIQLLGQVSLLCHERASIVLSLAQTGDLDALLTMDHVVKEELKRTLKMHGLVYDEDSYLIWIPPASKFEPLFDFEKLSVEAIDPESALVSKAVKAPAKNKQIIREAIACEEFPGLVDRILEHGGKLENFT